MGRMVCLFISQIVYSHICKGKILYIYSLHYFANQNVHCLEKMFSTKPRKSNFNRTTALDRSFAMGALPNLKLAVKFRLIHLIVAMTIYLPV